MIAAVAVQDINVMDLVKLMLQGIGGKYAGNPGIEAAAQQSGNAGLLKALPVGPLPAVLKFCRVLRLIVGGIHVIGFRSQTGVHNGQILVGQGQIQHHVRLLLFNQGDKLLHLVRVHLAGGDLRFGGPLQFLLQGVAFGFGAAGNADLLKHLTVLTAFVDGYRSHSAAADN